ncbi:MAG: hypothetical protein CL558_02485 [Alphaproteobacteria bacterium]|nr:hypothetical protein [Alphaproteobacteria bacterium]MAS49187.1 hypothetical protein [Alphaproteobacteria bacterium]MAX97211.1 hypothetical protein [Alphaproteobacteria bacterium]MBN52425.1 hypothetical protein [Alphaproteobacteria bacterium]OUT39780.1 MAG: hypothetical protein CBB62_15640 [Micavibrio sp. TMED2]|tara:strand:+ start:713 stop:964 length:252 start_codon:yes stop_codon:yes gene_type:complete
MMSNIQTQIVEAQKILNRPAVELLIDMLDNKLTCLEVIDRDDVRELKLMRDTMERLESWLVHAPSVLETGRRGRRPRVDALTA